MKTETILNKLDILFGDSDRVWSHGQENLDKLDKYLTKNKSIINLYPTMLTWSSKKDSNIDAKQLEIYMTITVFLDNIWWEVERMSSSWILTYLELLDIYYPDQDNRSDLEEIVWYQIK